MNLDNISIIMVETSHPGNVGAAARAMMNMGLASLRLVNPQCQLDADAYARASGANQVLDAARSFPSLTDALADCALVVGTSARSRSLEWPALSPHGLALKLAGQPDDSRAAVVFGREDSGLTNAELQHCHYSVTIPTNPGFSSLNVASAIQVISYEIYNQLQAGQARPAVRLSRADSAASGEQLEGFFDHLEQVLSSTGFIQQTNPRQMMKRLRRLFQRAEPTQNEVNILRGILSSVEKYRQHKAQN
jgi:tRNA/rRNA methyltransferase/tRNA (cytidine32/uridine32-2'-O)-methyltransferase